MPVDSRKRQKKQERRAAKRKAKVRELRHLSHAGLPERLTSAVRYPILDCTATTSLWTEGLGWVCLSRRLPNGAVAFGMFLIDRHCLGVKNAMADVCERLCYDTEIVRKMRSDLTAKEMHPAAARKLVEGAVAYASALGLHPHADYRIARIIFGDINTAERAEEFEFGKDGKPLFVADPYDGPDRCRRIMATLEQSCGADGYHYLIPVGGSSRIIQKPLRPQDIRILSPHETGVFEEWDSDDLKDGEWQPDHEEEQREVAI